jgi:D-arabinose 5-phosphate isomerase GutQ
MHEELKSLPPSAIDVVESILQVKKRKVAVVGGGKRGHLYNKM